MTEGLAAFYRAFAGHARVAYTPNGVDPTLFSPGPRARPLEAPRGDYALFYGDIAKWHGLDLMFAAARDKAWPDAVTLLLIGRGSAAQAPSVPPDLNGRVIWLDRQPQRALVPFIANAQVGLSPITDPEGRSAYGVMPLKLLEFLACARPVVVTDLPGQADLVARIGCGRVVAKNDPAALARAVAELSASSEAMGTAGRAAVEAHYSWDAIARKVGTLIACSLKASSPTLN